MDAPATSPAGKMPSYGIIENANSLTDVVLAAMAGAPDPRLREVMAAFVRHLHAFTREVKVTQDEYDVAIDFLNRIGQATNDAHNEGILFADAVGFSTLVCLPEQRPHQVDRDRRGACSGRSGATIRPRPPMAAASFARPRRARLCSSIAASLTPPGRQSQASKSMCGRPRRLASMRTRIPARPT